MTSATNLNDVNTAISAHDTAISAIYGSNNNVFAMVNNVTVNGTTYLFGARLTGGFIDM